NERPQRPQELPGLPAFRNGTRRILAMLQRVLVASGTSGVGTAMLPTAPFAAACRRLTRGPLPRVCPTARGFPDGVDRSVHEMVPPFSHTPPTALGPPVVRSPATTACPPAFTYTC